MKAQFKKWRRSIATFMKDFKGEKTIRSETTKVFLVIFAILVTIGTFTVWSSVRGARTFSNIQEIYLKEFQSSEKMTQKALDIIAIYYLLASDQDMNILMNELQRYDGLAEAFQKNLGELTKLIETEPNNPNKLGNIQKVKGLSKAFDDLNNDARTMTFALMEGNKEKSKEAFSKVSSQIGAFKVTIEDIEKSIANNLTRESSSAKGLLEKTTWAGFLITVLGVLGTLKLISYLMGFLSVTLLPISNLMHNMRQAVFAIDDKLNVIAPVSKYTSSVFEAEVVGKSVDDFLYSGLDPKGEVRAGLTTAMGAVFNSDDVQWMLMEDNFPTQVRFAPPSDPENQKILKLTYTPLWNEEANLQSLMIVAEDVTEIEKLRLEATRKAGEISILLGLVNMDRSEVAPFLNLARDQVNESKDLIETMESNLEGRQLLFRTLHTLKGNSRMFGLSTISEAVHAAEAIVVEINKTLAAGEPLGNDLKQSLFTEMSSVEAVLGEHFTAANRLMGIENSFNLEKAERLRTSLIETEAYLWNEGNFNKEHLQKLVEKVNNLATFFKSDDLFADLNTLLEEEKTLPKYRESLLQVGIKNAQFNFERIMAKPLVLDHSHWLPLFVHLYDLGSAFLSWCRGEEMALEHLKSTCRNIISHCEVNSLGYPLAQVEKIIFQSALPGSTKEIHKLICSLWNYMALISQLDGIGFFAKNEAQSIDPWTTVGIEGKHIFIVFVSNLKRRGIPSADFKKIANQFMPSAIASWELFLGHKEFASELDLIFDAISASKLETLFNSTEPFKAINPILGEILNEHKYSGQLFVEIARVMIPKLQSIDHERYGLSRKMIEIPESSFKHLMKEVHGMTAENFDSKAFERSRNELSSIVNRAFELPIKSILWKMNPMVKEFSAKLGKKVELKVSGKDITLPRRTLHDLRDALVHMVRNSLDHGIEALPTRVANGKQEFGTIHINCLENADGRSFELVVQDDGGGINVDKLVSKAISNGSLTQEVADAMSEMEKMELIFKPNLSTKDDVTDLSGRGVGMDAVKAIITKLEGTIKIDSKLGVGTKFTLTIKRPESMLDLDTVAA